MREMFRVLRGRVGIVHLKDFRMAGDGVSYDLPGPLKGVMNYGLLAELLRDLDGEVPVVAEHVGPAEFAATRQGLLGVLSEVTGGIL